MLCQGKLQVRCRQNQYPSVVINIIPFGYTLCKAHIDHYSSSVGIYDSTLPSNIMVFMIVTECDCSLISP